MAVERTEIAQEDKWNVEALYSSLEAWEKELQKWEKETAFAHLTAAQGSLGESQQKLKGFLEDYFSADRELSKLYTYAHLRHDEDVGEEKSKRAYLKAVTLLTTFREVTAWVEPEILQFSKEKIAQILVSKELELYHIYLEKIVRLKSHTLSPEQEKLLALASLPLTTAQRSFSAFNNGDLKFPPVIDSQNETRELTQGTYLLYLTQEDRVLRESTFKTLHRSFKAYENTLCELIQGQVQSHVFEAKARNYSSCLEAALFPNQIDPVVYKSLIEAVHQNLGSLHRYISLRKECLGYEELHAWDLFIPLVQKQEISIPYSEAVNKILASLSPLGEDYKRDLERGLKVERWVDRYENVRKRSGAYSSGCYDSMPYILMNYHATFRDLMTLTHEAGHSMQTLLSARHQPYPYAHYPIFVAEVASTFHEELLFHHLLSEIQDPSKKAYIINQRIDDIRATFFRQVMFAEFELKVHEWVEQGIPLTPAFLKEEYRKLNRLYFGPDFTLDEEIDIEWARIPHFYYNFYVYQYATGISAAHALVELVKKEGESGRKKYLSFLSSGSSQYPLDLLKLAGVDMNKGDAVKSLMKHFDALVSELASLHETAQK